MQSVVRNLALCVLFAAVFVFAQDSNLAAASSKAVMVGGEADFDACGGSGVVVGLDPKGDGFLAVRAGPGSQYKMVEKLENGQPYFDCDQHGSWVGIVYTNNAQIDCGVGSPIAKRQPYGGPCKSGWVFKKFTKLIAG